MGYFVEVKFTNVTNYSMDKNLFHKKKVKKQLRNFALEKEELGFYRTFFIIELNGF